MHEKGVNMYIAKQNNLIVQIGETENEIIQKTQFMPQVTIEQTDKVYVLFDGKYMTEQEKEILDRQKTGMLSITRGDLFEAIILALGKSKSDLRTMIETAEGLSDIEKMLYLNRFDEALNFYRGHPAVDLLGSMLGITSERLDKFFKTKDYKELL